MSCADSVASGFSNASIAFIGQHAQMRAVESNTELLNETLGLSAQTSGRYTAANSTTMRMSSTSHYQHRPGHAPEPVVSLRRPFRLLRKQHHATRGRKQRLLGWYYVRRLEDREVVAAVRQEAVRERSGKGAYGKIHQKARGKGEDSLKGKGGKLGGADHHCALKPFGPLQEKLLLQELEQKPIYHVVIRGNDLRFVPPGDNATCDVVTNYFVTGIDELRELLLLRLDDVLSSRQETGEEPADAFRDLLSDQAFVGLLEEYYWSGDPVLDRSLHLVGRLKGHRCFLHNAIKANDVELLKELLESYTNTPGRRTASKEGGQEETTVCSSPSVSAASLAPVSTMADRFPWLRLSEPLQPMGAFKISAFHRAVYDGRVDCLELLLDWAARNSLEGEIVQLRNKESRIWQQENGGLEGMDLLQMAEAQRNFACYNRLAPLFRVPPRTDQTVDEASRENSLHAMVRPRVELEVSLRTFILPVSGGDGETTWVALGRLGAQLIEEVVFRFDAEASKGERGARDASNTKSTFGNSNIFVPERLLCALSFHFLQVSEDATEEDALQVFSMLMSAADKAWRAAALTVVYINIRAVRVPDPARTSFAFLKALQKWDRQDFAMGNQCMWNFVFCPRLDTLKMEAATQSQSVLETDVQRFADEMLRRSLESGGFENVALRAPVERALHHRLLAQPALGKFMALWDGLGPDKMLKKLIRRFLYQYQNVVEKGDQDNLIDGFETSLLLQYAAQAVLIVFWDVPKLLRTLPTDARDNLDSRVSAFLGWLLLMWFRSWPVQAATVSSADHWALFCDKITTHLGFHPAELAAVTRNSWDELRDTFRGALDLGLESFLRMDVGMGHAYQRTLKEDPDSLREVMMAATKIRGNPVPDEESAAGSELPVNFLQYAKKLIPETAVAELPRVRSRLRKLEKCFGA